MTTATERDVRALLDSPEGRRLTDQRKADALAVREAKVALLKSTDAEERKALPPLQEKTKAAALTVAAARDALLAAQRCHGEALSAEAGVRGQIDAERGKLQRELRESAPGEIAAFIRELAEDFDRTRRIPIDVHGGGPNRFGEREPIGSHNANAVQNRLQRITLARETAKALMLEALDGGELAKRLNVLRRSVEGGA